MSRLFNYVDDDFKLMVQSGEARVEVDRGLRFSSVSIESRWEVPNDLANAKEFAEQFGISGTVLASEKPLPSQLRGVSLYVRGRLANEAEFYDVPESSYAFSYLTGYLDVDFIDDDQDLIATDQRSLDWEAAEAIELRNFLNGMLREVADSRKERRRGKKKERLKAVLGLDAEKWSGTIQGPEAGSVKEVLEVLSSPESEISREDRDILVSGLLEIAPEYADLHWRNLHPRIQEASDGLYRSEHYFHAVVEAIKRYVADVKVASGVNGVDLSAINEAFGGSPKLDVFGPFLQSGFSDNTCENIRSGQRTMSQGIWQGFRNPLSHEEVEKLRDEGAFTYQDCLDALSIVSHLRRRLDQAIVQ